MYRYGTHRQGKYYIIHILKSVRHKNTKVLIYIAIIYELKVWNQDVSQAYIQANDLERDVYEIADKTFGLPTYIILKLLKPLYGLTEWGDYRFDKYETFLKRKVCFQYIPSNISFYNHKLDKTLTRYASRIRA